MLLGNLLGLTPQQKADYLVRAGYLVEGDDLDTYEASGVYMLSGAEWIEFARPTNPAPYDGYAWLDEAFNAVICRRLLDLLRL